MCQKRDFWFLSVHDPLEIIVKDKKTCMYTVSTLYILVNLNIIKKLDRKWVQLFINLQQCHGSKHIHQTNV